MSVMSSGNWRTELPLLTSVKMKQGAYDNVECITRGNSNLNRKHVMLLIFQSSGEDLEVVFFEDVLLMLKLWRAFVFFVFFSSHIKANKPSLIFLHFKKLLVCYVVIVVSCVL